MKGDINDLPPGCVIGKSAAEVMREAGALCVCHEIIVPIKLPSLANVRMHWRQLSRLKIAQKAAVKACLIGRLPDLPVTVTITRVGPRQLDDDNLAASCKYVRDTIADAYGVDDGSELYKWVYLQEKGKYAVKIKIERGA